MTLKECYTALEGDYESVLSRLMMEKLVNKFVLKFLNDGSYNTLVESLGAGNLDEAFRAAHTLKGVCQNLSFTKLYESSHEMTEALRDKDVTKANELLPRVEADYLQTVSAIKNLG
ncbi:MAG: Hpt domain-containing protein [Ruminococcus flavefaciens]|nr:Hpt domain-containing protein [Ruminococcus flavefaciens]MCM1229571.1 Hpt domain-containing protein [Ruminococcus flavefaciens]